MAAAALALVWTAPEKNGGPPPVGDRHHKTGNGHSTPATILVVEDEVLIRLAVADYLRDCGYRVVEASSGEEAQQILRTGEPVEILFSDVDLGGGINGFELCRWTREHYPLIRILLTSGVARMSQEAQHLCDGEFLNKPYSHSALSDQIKRLIGLFGRKSG
jgi:CheY-like chemotaxis protein